MDTTSWEGWKKSLASAVDFSEGLGASDDQISNFAVKLGSYLSTNVSPDIAENKSLKELWKVASPEEQKVIANCMVKLVKSDKQ
ncbi:MAG: DUF3243 domain-containing protein [Ruminiclostridium sp.]|nr:DUF3243 domain-containing protein [Ruminiclostridium sp.]